MASETALESLLSALGVALAHRSGPIWVGCSGGLDSLTLLHLTAQCCAEAGRSPPGVVHVHHGLHAQADRAEALVSATAAALGAPFQGVRVRVKRAGQGLEAAARAARYEVFETVLGPGGCLLLAHHEQDQAETVLLRLLRGAGPEGLAAMAPERPLGAGQLLRPWLRQPRARLEAVAAQLGLTPVDDPSNDDTRFDRNYLRQVVWPLLESRWPGFPARLAHSAAALRRAQAAPSSPLSTAGAPLPLSALPDGLEAQGDAVYQWLRAAGLAVPRRARLLSFCAQLGARDDAQPAMALGEVTLRRWAQALWLVPSEPPPLQARQPLGVGSLPLPGGLLEVGRAAPEAADLPPGSYTLCQGPLPGATRLRSAPGRRTKTVKALLQEARIPPWERPYLPQLWQGEQFLGWPGIALASFSAQGQGLEAQGWTFRWRPHRYPSPQTR